MGNKKKTPKLIKSKGAAEHGWIWAAAAHLALPVLLPSSNQTGMRCVIKQVECWNVCIHMHKWDVFKCSWQAPTSPDSCQAGVIASHGGESKRGRRWWEEEDYVLLNQLWRMEAGREALSWSGGARLGLLISKGEKGKKKQKLKPHQKNTTLLVIATLLFE